MRPTNSPIIAFQRITGYPILEFFLDFKSFMNNYATSISAFYGGDVTSANAAAFDALHQLQKDSVALMGVFESFNSYFNNAQFWDLLEQVETIRTKLKVYEESSRWLRSSVAKGSFSAFNLSEITQQQKQTLESMALNVSGALNKENEWVDIALNNDLREEDYTPAGGAQVEAKSLAGQLTITSIVDTLNAESVYGKDIQQRLEFSTTDQDLVVLTPIRTINQAVSILANLRSGDNPEFETQGIQVSQLAGSSLAAFQYPSLIRQLRNVFEGDDTLASFKITNIQQDVNKITSKILIEFEVNTRLGEILTESITI